MKLFNTIVIGLTIFKFTNILVRIVDFACSLVRILDCDFIVELLADSKWNSDHCRMGGFWFKFGRSANLYPPVHPPPVPLDSKIRTHTKTAAKNLDRLLPDAVQLASDQISVLSLNILHLQRYWSISMFCYPLDLSTSFGRKNANLLKWVCHLTSGLNTIEARSYPNIACHWIRAA